MNDRNDSSVGENKFFEEPNNVSNNDSTMLESQELNESERDIMKGDTIGDTVYSSSWIINTLKTLIEVTDEGFTPPVEAQLCILWDTTADRDVALYLLNFDFFQVIDYILRATTNPRLSEILLGIVGNLCCQTEAVQKLYEQDNLVECIFHYLNNNDPQTIFHVVRILKCVMWDFQINENSPWWEKFMKFDLFGSSICFILASSKNDQLLTISLELVEQVSAVSSESKNLLEQWFDTEELMLSIFECFKQLFAGGVGYTNSELNILRNWLTIFNHIVSTEKFKTDTGFENEMVYMNAIKVLEMILKSFSVAFTVPMKSISTECIGMGVEIMMWFLKNRGYYETDVIAIVPAFMVALKTDLAETTIETNDLAHELDLLEYLEQCWAFIQDALDEQKLHTITVMCKSILKNERETSEVELEKMIQTLTVNSDSESEDSE